MPWARQLQFVERTEFHRNIPCCVIFTWAFLGNWSSDIVARASRKIIVQALGICGRGWLNSGYERRTMSDGAGWQRLDMYLWCARMLRGRADCAALVGAGGVRINRQPTEKPHARVRVGDVITLPIRGDVLVLEITGLAERRGPATAARLLYRLIPEASAQGGDAAEPLP
jgi:ribosome-associated heat shock protein Hsp15